MAAAALKHVPMATECGASTGEPSPARHATPTTPAVWHPPAPSALARTTHNKPPCSRSRHVGLRAHGATEHVWLSCGGRWLTRGHIKSVSAGDADRVLCLDGLVTNTQLNAGVTGADKSWVFLKQA